MSGTHLAPGDPAPAECIWFRPITNGNHVRRNGNLHHSALKGNAIAPPGDARKPWKAELSGRLRALAGDAAAVVADGEERVERLRRRAADQGRSASMYEFKGVIAASVHSIRTVDAPRMDVIYDPVIGTEHEDRAHSNIVFYDEEADHVLTRLDEVVTLFRVIAPADMQRLFA